MIPGQYALVSFARHRCRTCFRNLLRVLPVLASALTQLMDLTIRKVAKTPIIHFRGPEGSAVLAKGGNRGR